MARSLRSRGLEFMFWLLCMRVDAPVRRESRLYDLTLWGASPPNPACLASLEVVTISKAAEKTLAPEYHWTVPAVVLLKDDQSTPRTGVSTRPRCKQPSGNQGTQHQCPQLRVYNMEYFVDPVAELPDYIHGTSLVCSLRGSGVQVPRPLSHIAIAVRGLRDLFFSFFSS